MTDRLIAWLDHRLDLSGVHHFVAEKSVPVHKHKVWYYMGGITLFLVGVQIFTGILLLLYYRPSANEAEFSRAMGARKILRKIVIGQATISDRPSARPRATCFGTSSPRTTCANVSTTNISAVATPCTS